MLCEGVGRGYLATHFSGKPANLMEYYVRDGLMVRLIQASPQQSFSLLADTWNLLEGLLREPRWVNSYVMARARELDNEDGLHSFLVRELNPLFERTSPSTWNGPSRVSMLSLRDGDDEFLPGEMHLVAPTVLAVKDRRRDTSWGVLLRKQGQSELAGLFGDTSPYVEEPSFTPPRWQGEWTSFGKERIRLPFLLEPLHWLQVRAGFLVASAINSQKLWIVESAT
jgi:hypothetical protein